MKCFPAFHTKTIFVLDRMRHASYNFFKEVLPMNTELSIEARIEAAADAILTEFAEAFEELAQ